MVTSEEWGHNGRMERDSLFTFIVPFIFKNLQCVSIYNFMKTNKVAKYIKSQN
jgi:hypothetical protein